MCECEFDAAGVAQHGNQQAQYAGRIRFQARDWSRKRVLAREMCFSAEKVLPQLVLATGVALSLFWRRTRTNRMSVYAARVYVLLKTNSGEGT